MPPLLVERVRRLRRWLIPATLLALTPKCVLCLLAYTGLGIALGFGGPELCGAPAESARPKIEARLLHDFFRRLGLRRPQGEIVTSLPLGEDGARHAR